MLAYIGAGALVLRLSEGGHPAAELAFELGLSRLGQQQAVFPLSEPCCLRVELRMTQTPGYFVGRMYLHIPRRKRSHDERAGLSVRADRPRALQPTTVIRPGASGTVTLENLSHDLAGDSPPNNRRTLIGAVNAHTVLYCTR